MFRSGLLPQVSGVVVAWVIVGAVFGVYEEKWATSKSVMFGIGTMSTAGLIAPTTGTVVVTIAKDRDTLVSFDNVSNFCLGNLVTV